MVDDRDVRTRIVVCENRVVVALVVISCAGLVCTEATDVLLMEALALNPVFVVALRIRKEVVMVLEVLSRGVGENERA